MTAIVCTRSPFAMDKLITFFKRLISCKQSALSEKEAQFTAFKSNFDGQCDNVNIGNDKQMQKELFIECFVRNALCSDDDIVYFVHGDNQNNVSVKRRPPKGDSAAIMTFVFDLSPTVDWMQTLALNFVCALEFCVVLSSCKKFPNQSFVVHRSCIFDGSREIIVSPFDERFMCIESDERDEENAHGSTAASSAVKVYFQVASTKPISIAEDEHVGIELMVRLSDGSTPIVFDGALSFGAIKTVYTRKIQSKHDAAADVPVLMKGPDGFGFCSMAVQSRVGSRTVDGRLTESFVCLLSQLHMPLAETVFCIVTGEDSCK